MNFILAAFAAWLFLIFFFVIFLIKHIFINHGAYKINCQITKYKAQSAESRRLKREYIHKLRSCRLRLYLKIKIYFHLVFSLEIKTYTISMDE